MDAFHLFLVYAGYAVAAFGVLFASINGLVSALPARLPGEESALSTGEALIDDAMYLGRIEMPALHFITSFLIALVAAILHRMID